MAFDTQGALQAGYTQDEINAYLAQNKPAEPKKGMLQNIVESPLIPGIGMVGGAIGGAALTSPGIITTPAGIAGGGALGWSGGEALQNSLKDILGYQNQTPAQQLGNTANNAGRAGVASYLGATALAGLMPGQARSFFGQEKAVPKDILGERYATIPGKYIRPETVKASRELSGNLYEKMFPLTGEAQAGAAPITRPSEISLPNLYKNLIQLKKEVPLYDKNTPEPIRVAATDIDRETRSLANEYGGTMVKVLNKYMSGRESLVHNPLLRKMGIAGGGLGLLWTLGKIMGGKSTNNYYSSQ